MGPTTSLLAYHFKEQHQANQWTKTEKIQSICAISCFIQIQKSNLYVFIFLSVLEAYDIYEQILGFSN